VRFAIVRRHTIQTELGQRYYAGLFARSISGVFHGAKAARRPDSPDKDHCRIVKRGCKSRSHNPPFAGPQGGTKRNFRRPAAGPLPLPLKGSEGIVDRLVVVALWSTATGQGLVKTLLNQAHQVY